MINYSCKNGHVELETDGTGKEVATDAVLLVVTLYRELLEKIQKLLRHSGKYTRHTLIFLWTPKKLTCRI